MKDRLKDEDFEILKNMARDPTGLRGDLERLTAKQDKESKFNKRIAVIGLIVAVLSLLLTIVQLIAPLFQ